METEILTNKFAFAGKETGECCGTVFAQTTSLHCIKQPASHSHTTVSKPQPSHHIKHTHHTIFFHQFPPIGPTPVKSHKCSARPGLNPDPTPLPRLSTHALHLTMSPTHCLRLIMASLLITRAISATSSVALSDFIPAIESLPQPCATVYNQVISGCVAADFDASKQRCSAACVSGLVEISQAVSRSCSLDDVSETSIIGVFLQGQGIPILCQGVSVTTIGASSSTTTTTSSSTKAQATSTRDAASNTADASSSSAPSSTLVTSAANPDASTLTQAVPTTPAAAQPSFIWSLPADSSTAAPAQTASSQKSNSDSGGGSPFDVVATGSSSQSHIQHFSASILGAILSLALLVTVVI